MSELIIYDPEDRINYRILLNLEDHNRAQEDEKFLTTLLEHAKTMNAKEIQEVVTQECQYDAMEENEPSCSNDTINKKVSGHWDCDQTKALIKSMATHMSDLNNIKKRKFVFDNVANDLLSLGIDVTPITVQNKWKSLVRSYQKCKDIKTRTGQGPSRFYFFEEMDEILGLKPTNECSHSLNSTFSSQQENDDCNVQYKENMEPLESTKTLEETTSSERNIMKKRKPAVLKMEYMQKKMKEYDDRNERHKEKMLIEKKRLEVEERKLNLLEALIKPP